MDGAAWKAAAIGVGIVLAAAFGPLIYSLLRRAGQTRTNFRGETIPTSGGALFALPLLGLALVPFVPVLKRPDLIQAATAIGFCALGFLDDRWSSSEFKGLRGHLKALSRGRVTTGLVKAVGGLGIAWAAAAQFHGGVTLVAAALVIALSANAFNLLDLRPLRALKAFWPASVALALVLPISHALVLGVSLVYAREEGRRRVMLGDAGSNLLGALIGTTAAFALPAWSLWALTALLAAFHLWAEKYSLTAWIGERKWAQAVDNWGVAPTDPADPTDHHEPTAALDEEKP